MELRLVISITTVCPISTSPEIWPLSHLYLNHGNWQFENIADDGAGARSCGVLEYWGNHGWCKCWRLAGYLRLSLRISGCWCPTQPLVHKQSWPHVHGYGGRIRIKTIRLMTHAAFFDYDRDRGSRRVPAQPLVPNLPNFNQAIRHLKSRTNRFMVTNCFTQWPEHDRKIHRGNQ